MVDLQRRLHRIDRLQQSTKWSAFPVAVVKKYGDKRGSALAALLTYYGFLSLFPLLLAATTVLGYVLPGNAKLQRALVNSAVVNFPILGSDIARNVRSLHGNNLALLVGTIGALYGGLGIANSAQDAMNRIWSVPPQRRRGFVPRTLRSLRLIGSVGVGLVCVSTVGSATNFVGSIGVFGRVAMFVAVTVLDIAIVWMALVTLPALKAPWRMHMPGAIVAGVVWHILEVFGGLYVTRVLRGMDQTYGLFAIVIGLLGWINIQSQVVLFAATLNVVKARKEWPRSFMAPAPDVEF